MIYSQDDLSTSPWKDTYRKQQRHLLKRERANQADGGNESSPAAPSDESYDSNSVFPVFKRVSPQTEAATPAKSTAVSTSVLSISDDSDGDEISPLVSPATSTPFSEGSTDQVLISAMASLVVSSSSKKPSLPVSAFTSSVRRRKYYVVSVGKRTGVFDNWPYVHKLTNGVRGACQKSYATLEEAEDVYRVLKEKGLVNVVRDPGDDVAFGLLEDAVQ